MKDAHDPVRDAALWRRSDANGEGHLPVGTEPPGKAVMTQEEASSLFDRIDADKDGQITLGEWHAHVQATGGNLLDVYTKFQRSDRDGSRAVDRKEFVDYHVRY
ncbi:EF-hand domain-containing protein [Streptomyces sp. NPDC057798]|uniref:EF-hand domain-containing protein n=1 Tax=Streptomyces sp. NPDC057798 TaxID=3346252 RepID=UPI0036D033D4